jgi:hypothetical protein
MPRKAEFLSLVVDMLRGLKDAAGILLYTLIYLNPIIVRYNY